MSVIMDIGYYWVRQQDGDQWVVALFGTHPMSDADPNDSASWWYFADELTGSEPFEVGPKLNPPSGSDEA